MMFEQDALVHSFFSAIATANKQFEAVSCFWTIKQLANDWSAIAGCRYSSRAEGFGG